MPDSASRLPRPCAALALACCLIAPPLFAQQRPAPVVQVAPVSRAELAPTIAVPGTVYSRNELQVTAGVNGQLEWVAEPGTIIDAGTPVARIDTRALRLQREEQEALLERAEISVRRLQNQLARQRELHARQLVSAFDLEQTQADRDLAANDASIARVRVRQIDDQIRRANVVAPFAGVMISRQRRAGEDVTRGEVIGHLTDVRNLEVRAFVPLKHLPRTVVGDPLDVLASESRHIGSIRALVPTGDVRSQTFEARIDLPAAASETLTVGQLVSVAIPIRAKSAALTVPRDALVLRANGHFVFRINAENRAEQIRVTIGDSAGDLVAVEGDLLEGERVAVRGAENLSEGADVRIMLSRTPAPSDDA